MFPLLSVLVWDRCRSASLLCKARFRSRCFCLSVIDSRVPGCCVIAMFALLSVLACDHCNQALLLCKLRLGLAVSVCLCKLRVTSLGIWFSSFLSNSLRLLARVCLAYYQANPCLPFLASLVCLTRCGALSLQSPAAGSKQAKPKCRLYLGLLATSGGKRRVGGIQNASRKPALISCCLAALRKGEPHVAARALGFSAAVAWLH
jgi:hypothetical protein